MRSGRPFLSLLTWLLVLIALASGAVASCGKSQNTAQNEPPSSTSANPPPAKPATEATNAPAAGGQAQAGDLGAKVYAQRCALCHGPAGHGDGPGAAGLNPKPRNHTDGSYMNGRTDAQLLQVIHNGKGAMPAWGKVLSEEEIQAALKHVRSLAQPPYPGPH